MRYFIIPTILIIVMFVIGNILTIRGIRIYNYNTLEQQSRQYAQNYAHQITKSAQAIEIINDLLVDKLRMASNSVALHADNVNDEILSALAMSLEIDEISYYNPDGQIIYSNQSQLVGWTSYPGHPVEDFRQSNQRLLIEDIRPDSESGTLSIFSYVRTPQGFFQLGLRSDRVDSFDDVFEPGVLLAEMVQDAQADTIWLLNKDLVVQSSSDPNLIGVKFEDPSILEALARQETYARLGEFAGRRVYQVFAPVRLDGVEVGILGMTTALTATQRVVRDMTTWGVLVVTVVFGALSYATYTTYRRKQNLIEMAYHDSSSGLPNRRRLLDAVIENENHDTALLLVHIRNFADVNHVYGFHAGNTLFNSLANHLQTWFKERYQVFHVAGNRLVVYVSNSLPKRGLIDLANEIIEATNKGIEEQGFEGQLDVRVAIVEIDHPDTDPEKIFAHASMALMHHEDESPQPYVFFKQNMDDRVLRADIIERELLNNLNEPDPTALWVEYQPIVDLRSKNISGFEALARMRLPELGMIPPPEFINIAERTQLAVRLGKLALAESCKFLNKLDERGFDDISVSINISAADLRHPGFYDRMFEVLAQHKVSPRRITLEITEVVMMKNFTKANAVLQRLRDAGMQIAIDDFGTGYSSFSRVEDLNVDIIKIDKFFVDKILSNQPEQLVLGDLVSMCQRLGFKVVAEGVEEEGQRQYLVEHNCDMMQGYLFSRPLSADGALAILNTQGGATG